MLTKVKRIKRKKYAARDEDREFENFLNLVEKI